MVAPTLLSIWDWPTRMRMLEARMETQKLSRMMERSDLMNLRGQELHGARAPACPMSLPHVPHSRLATGSVGQSRHLSHQAYSPPNMLHLIPLMLSLCCPLPI